MRESEIRAVVFDMDGVLIESEGLWDRVREELTDEHGGTWSAGAHRDMMGMSSLEWPVYMRDELRLDIKESLGLLVRGTLTHKRFPRMLDLEYQIGKFS